LRPGIAPSDIGADEFLPDRVFANGFQ